MPHKLRRDFFPQSLRVCTLAGSVTSVLDKHELGQTLSEVDKGILATAQEFLEAATEGKKISETLKLNEKAVESSYAYGKAIGASRVLKSEGHIDETSLEEIFNNLAKTVGVLVESGKVPQKSAGRLRGFFDAVRTSTLQENAGVTDRAEIKE